MTFTVPLENGDEVQDVAGHSKIMGSNIAACNYNSQQASYKTTTNFLIKIFHKMEYWSHLNITPLIETFIRLSIFVMGLVRLIL